MIPRVRLSPKYATGTIQQRMKYADRLNEQLFSRIFPLYKNKDAVEIGRIEEECAFTIPETIDFRIERLSKKDSKKCYALIQERYNKKSHKMEGYVINIPAKLDKLDVSNLSLLIHENTHMLDAILIPKIIRNCEKLHSKNLHTFARNLFLNEYYTNIPISVGEKGLKKQTKKAISNLSAENKLLVLNFLKNSILMEKHAHLQGRKSAQILKYTTGKYRPEDVNYLERDYLFDERLKIVNRMIYETIRKERYINAQRRAKNPLEKAWNFIKYHSGM